MTIAHSTSIISLFVFSLSTINPVMASDVNAFGAPYTGPLQPVINTSYGITKPTLSVVPATSFLPLDSIDTYTHTRLGNKCTTSNSILYAALPDDIPDGARVTSIDFHIADNDASADVAAMVGIFHSNQSTGANFTGQAITPTYFSSGQPGDTIVTVSTPFTVDRTQDINTDGSPELLSYELAVFLGNTGNVCINQAAMTWYRQISPAPATATFTDVPTNHWAFQEVEALAASGITTGCGGTEFCPDAVVTRAHMAIFLSRTLGLHWGD